MTSPPTARAAATAATHSTSANSGLASLLALTVSFVAPALAAEGPLPVSPGAASAGWVSEPRCVSYSWSGAPGARGYEIAVFKMPVEDGEPVLVTRASVSGDARTYTPPASQCLERGARYAWSVAAHAGPALPGSDDAQLDWSKAFLFEVEAAPSDEEVEQAIATLQRHLETRGRDGRASTAASEVGRHAAEDDAEDDVERARTAQRARAAPRDVNGKRRPRLELGRDFPFHEALVAPTTGPRIASAASAPTWGPASLSLSGQIHLAEESALFRDGRIFLWASDDDESTALGRSALRSASAGALDNTAFGYYSLASTTTGEYNTGAGSYALANNLTGSHNTAIGAEALVLNGSGYQNTATGHAALRANSTGYNNTATGAEALRWSTGDRNSALGFQAGFGVLSGNGNTFLGASAGTNANSPFNSIFINNPGAAGDTSTIKIGTSGVQATAFLAGNLGLGFPTGTPENRLHVRESIDADGGVPGNHVAQIENTSTGSGADVLALKIGRDHSDGGATVGSGNNFVTFFDGDDSVLGEIQGTTSGGIELVSGNADFAEWLPRLDPSEPFEPGDVVGLHGGGLSKRTAGASRVFVVSTAPILTGNDPGEPRQTGHARVAFLGQAPVKVRGPVRAGDLLAASGRGDGTAVVLAAADLERADASPPLLVGRALEPSDGGRVSSVRVLIGLPGDDPFAELLRRQASEIVRLQARLAKLERRSRAAG